jgi:uncharacterized protein YbaR (Trm112 family)
MMLSPTLRGLLRCPESKGELLYFAATESDTEFLFCPVSRLKYPVVNGIPVMLVEEAERVSVELAAELAAKVPQHVTR